MKGTLVPAALCFAVLLAAASVSSAQTGANPPGKAVAPAAGMSGIAMKPSPEMDYLGEIGTPDGKWTSVWEMICKK